MEIYISVKGARCHNLKNISHAEEVRPMKIAKKQITINFTSSDQIIKNESLTCYNTDIFEVVKEKIFLKYPQFRDKELIFLSGGKKFAN